jgi:hypothetical protein
MRGITMRVMRIGFRLLLALLLAGLLPVARPHTAQAAAEWGYLWSLDFDFEQRFDGVLTIKVGPWKDGELVEVSETSTAIVSCAPVGDIALDAGDAVFKGAGHIECKLDLAAVVWNNHKLQINPVDNYGSIVLRARVNGAANAVAPLFTHPNARYSLDFTQTSAVTLNHELWNNVGPLGVTVPGVTINTWQTYTYLYQCISHGGPCEARLSAGGQTQVVPTAGSRVQFSTGPTTLDIGRDGGAYFTGRIAAIRIDPGNSAH